MKMKALLATIALVALVSPALAMGEGCNHDQQDAKVSCAEGTTWDAATGSCVTASS